ncbi:MAG: four helix bundle protein [Patescibacteria group bacterium]
MEVKINSYKDLIVWQKSMELSVLVYKLTDKFPKSEVFSLSNQIRRAVVSIPSNIAEGWARKGLGEYIQFLKISLGSASELETQLILSKNLSFGNASEYSPIELILLEIQKMLFGLVKKLKNK